jgi:hypothetical protein
VIVVVYWTKFSAEGGVKLTEQLAEPPLADSGHAFGTEKRESLDVKVTAPVGMGWPPETVAVHVVGVPSDTGFGEQLTLVEVERPVTVTVSP